MFDGIYGKLSENSPKQFLEKCLKIPGEVSGGISRGIPEGFFLTAPSKPSREFPKESLMEFL